MTFKKILGRGPAGAAGCGNFANHWQRVSNSSRTTTKQIPGDLNLCRRAIWGKPENAFVVLAALIFCAAACTTVKPFSQIDLKDPGWTVRQGQAVWHLPHGKAEIAGEVLLATRPEGESFVQFTKAPFALVIARCSAHHWQVEFPPENKHYAGPGTPPKRIIWLYLPRVLSGEPPPHNWTWRADSNGWRLENTATGEALEGYFS